MGLAGCYQKGPLLPSARQTQGQRDTMTNIDVTDNRESLGGVVDDHSSMPEAGTDSSDGRAGPTGRGSRYRPRISRSVPALRTALASASLLKYTNTSLPICSHSRALSAHHDRSS